MEDQNVLLELINQYPWLFYGLLVLTVILAFYAIIQGREFSFFGIKLGGKIKDQPVSQTQIQQQTQTVQIYSTLSQEQLNEVIDRVAKKGEVIRREADNQPPDVLYQPPDLPKRLAYIYSARHEIERKVRNLVLSHGGAWAGSSMADFDIYLDYAVTGRVITRELAGEITDFYIMFTQPMINFEDVSDEQFLEVQYLAAHINRQLDAIPLGPLE